MAKASSTFRPMTAMVPKLLLKDIARYLEQDANTLLQSYQSPNGTIEPRSIADEIVKVRAWARELRKAAV